MASTSSQNVTAHEDDIDNDILIDEVEKRAGLFDKKLKEYSDVNWKIKAWEEISRIIFSNVWGNLLPQQKTEAGKLVQKRWKNLRACFSRELRGQNSTKSGQAAKKRRKYKHFDQLLFFIPSMESRETSGNADSAEEVECEEDSRDPDEDVSVVHRNEHTRKKNTNKTNFEERLLEILNKKRVDDNKFIEALRNNNSNCDEGDKEKHFALSLVPLLKSVPEENKLEVQIRILKIFQDVQKQNSHNMMPFSYSFEQPREQIRRRTSTQLNYSPIYIPSTSPQNFHIKPKYSVSLPPPSPQTYSVSPSPQNQVNIATNTRRNSSPLSSPPNQNPVYCEDSSTASGTFNSIKSYISQFTPDSNEDSEVYAICQEYNISTQNT